MHLVASYGMGQAVGPRWAGAAADPHAPYAYYDPEDVSANAQGMVSMRWDEASREWWAVNPYLGRVQGAATPPAGSGGSGGAFNCPEGSDYAKSREVGMCVGADYDPTYTQSYPNAVKVYRNLDGTVAGTGDAPVPVNVKKRDTSGDWIPGVPNMAVVGVAGFLFMVWMRR